MSDGFLDWAIEKIDQTTHLDRFVVAIFEESTQHLIDVL